MKPRKFQVILFVGLIIFTGIFKNYVAELSTVPISYILDFLGFSHDALEKSLSFIANDKQIKFGLGVFFYYGLYVCLHLFLIHFLFQSTPIVKKNLTILLLLLVIGLGMMTIILKSIGFSDAGFVTYYMFNELVGRPLILFIVEGGGLIYESIENAFEN